MPRSAVDTFLILTAIAALFGSVRAACPEGDLENDCQVNFRDLMFLANYWLDGPGSPANLIADDKVDMADFSVIAKHWGEVGERTGSVLVEISPEAAVTRGAKWRIDGGPWQDSDQTLDELAVGSHTIEFKPIDIWAKPADKEIHVDQDLITRVTSAYEHPLRINEFMASNSTNTKDEHGEYDDWIEIFNSGDEAIDAAGMHLRDGDDNDWEFPGNNPLTTIAPGGYLLIWADDWTDNDVNDGPLHANFKLNADGDRLFLYDTDGESLIDSVDFGDQTTDISYGRDADDNWRFFPYPSPRWENIDAYVGAVDDTKFSHNRGFYDEPFSVTIVTETEGATIKYTTDGSTPSETAGRKYRASVPIETTTCLRAMAFKTGFKPTDVDTYTYIFLDEVIQHPKMSTSITQNPVWGPQMRDALLEIPTISLVTPYTIPDEPIQSPPEVPVSIEMIFPDGSKGFQANAGVERFGGQYTVWPKQALRVSFKSIYGPSRLEFDLFGDTPYGGDDATDSFNQIILRNGSHDSLWYGGYTSKGVYTRNRYCFDRQMEMGHLSLRGRFVHMYLNGVYWGHYHLMERPTADFMATYLGGDEEDYDIMKGRSGIFNIEGERAAWDYLVAHKSNYEIVQEYMDIDNYIDYMLLNFYGGNDHDWYSMHNWYAGRKREAGSKFIFFMWDNDFLMRRLNASTLDNGGPSNMLNALAKHEDFKMRLADRAYKHFFNDGMLTPARVQADFTELTNRIERTTIPECARWKDEGRLESGITYTPDTLQQSVNWIKSDWADVRTAKVVQQMRDYNPSLYPDVDAPLFYINGEPAHGHYVSSSDLFSITTGSGTIYYTINGSDPRLPGGAVNTSSATEYTEPFSIAMSTHIKARTKVGRAWSPLNEATFAVGPVKENLRITEIMYYPMDTGNPSDPNKEYVELTNIGPGEINLNLVRFTNGVDFTFGDWALREGEYVLVVRDLAAFADEYPDKVSLVAGEYAGALNNGGERIEVLDAVGRPIMDFKYKDGWRSLTDGQGFSLTIIDPNDVVISETRPTLPGLAAHWKFDDGSGISAKDSAGINNGTLHGGPTWVNGFTGGALSFDGQDDYVSTSSVGALATDSVTVEAWVRLEGPTGASYPILTQHLPTYKGYYLHVNGNKPSFSLVAGRPSPSAISPNAIESGQWHHIAGTNDGSNIKIYVNGQLKATADSAGANGVDYSATIGLDDRSSTYFEGLIDDVRIYNRALSEEELQQSPANTKLVERWNEKDSWRASAYEGGSPGEDDGGIIPNPGSVVINEIMAHSHADAPDWVELYNTTDAEIDI
ncbi:MAG: lamin tail domain-containing protein, partial [Phycisphaerales bacterium]